MATLNYYYPHSEVLPPPHLSLLILLILLAPAPLGHSTTGRVLAANGTSATLSHGDLSEVPLLEGKRNIEVLPSLERKPNIHEGAVISSQAWIRPTMASMSYKSASLIRPTARTSPSYTPLIPGMISGGIGITLVPQGPWVPHVQLREPASSEPYFEGDSESNVTARLGSTAYLDCRIEMLHNLTVTWLHRKNDSVILLTVGFQTYSRDSRFSISYRNPNNWRLKILSVVQGDEGSYECQVATHPIKFRRIFFKVNKPELKIVVESSEEALENYYQAGSEVKLTCLASYMDGGNWADIERDEEEDQQLKRTTIGVYQISSTPCHPCMSVASKVLWRRGDATISPGTKAVVIWSTSSADGRNMSVTLTFNAVKEEDGGNYTCSLDGITSTAVFLRIMNGVPHGGQNGLLVSPVGIGTLWLLFCSVSLSLRIGI